MFNKECLIKKGGVTDLYKQRNLRSRLLIFIRCQKQDYAFFFSPLVNARDSRYILRFSKPIVDEWFDKMIGTK